MKAKALFTLYEKFQIFESRNENVVFVRKKPRKLINGRGILIRVGARCFFRKKKLAEGLTLIWVGFLGVRFEVG